MHLCADLEGQECGGGGGGGEEGAECGKEVDLSG